MVINSYIRLYSNCNFWHRPLVEGWRSTLKWHLLSSPMVPAPPGSVLIIISSVLWIAETISEDYVLITNVSFCLCQAYYIMWYPYNVRFAAISWLKPNQIFWTPSFKWTIMNIELSFVLMEDVSWLRIRDQAPIDQNPMRLLLKSSHIENHPEDLKSVFLIPCQKIRCCSCIIHFSGNW